MPIILIDGVKYEERTPANEDELEQAVKEHAEDIFGEDSIYFDIKHKLKSKAGIGSIPDGYVIILGDQPHWHIVEVELSSHPLYEHIVPQVSRFINGIKNPSTQKDIADALYQEIGSDEFLKLRLKKAIGTTEAYKFLSDLLSKSPVVTIIIEKHTEQLEEAIGALAHSQIKVVEFRTFTREGVGLKVHAHSFEPIRKPTVVKEPTPVEVPEETWSKQEILEFWNSLTEDAKAALRVIAKQPDGCPRDDVLAELEIDGRQLSGRMSSVGHTLHNFPTKLRPVELDWSTRKYKMITELSRAVAELSL